MISKEELNHYPELVAWIEQDLQKSVSDVERITFSRNLASYIDEQSPLFRRYVPTSIITTVAFFDGEVGITGKVFSWVPATEKEEEQAE